MRLWIAEKPSVARDIAAVLGRPQPGDGFITVGDDVVSWCVGHLLRQAPPEDYGAEHQQWKVELLPILPEQWKMLPESRTQSQLKVLQSLLKKASSVVHAGDSAREGQMIVDEILSWVSYRGPVKRLWLREMNADAIRAAIKNITPNEKYKPLYESALARSRADWMIGMNLTRGYTLAWQEKGNSGPLHIGRVQTPTLCMIVKRDLDIESFVPQNYYVLAAVFRHVNGHFTATWAPPPDADYLDASGHVLDKSRVAAVAAQIDGKTGRIEAFRAVPKEVSPPLPFSLGDLQKLANKVFGLSPSQTLKIAQSLYETHKLTSYPRTDYAHLPEDEHKLAPGIIAAVKSNFGTAWDFPGTPDFSLKSPAWNSSKIGDHHGIRPTNTTGKSLDALSPQELGVYRLIVRQFLAQFYPKYRYTSMSTTVECESHRFVAQGQSELDQGWRVLFPPDKSPTPPLPQMAVNDPATVMETQVKAEKTSPPPRFDGASIIDAMERAHLFVTDPAVKARLKDTGIGTPATRAHIVDSLLKRDYIQEVKQSKKKVYVSTPKGRALYNAVPEQLRKPDLTAYFEERLKEVERNELTLDAFLSQQTRFITKLIDDVRDGSVAAGMPTGLVTASPSSKSKSSGRKGKPSGAPRPLPL